MPQDQWLTVADVARKLNLMPDTVRDLERQGRLKAVRTLGGVRLFLKADVEGFIQEREQPHRADGRGPVETNNA